MREYEGPSSDWLNDREDEDDVYDTYDTDDSPSFEEFVDILNHQAWDEYPDEDY